MDTNLNICEFKNRDPKHMNQKLIQLHGQIRQMHNYSQGFHNKWWDSREKINKGMSLEDLSINLIDVYRALH